MTQHLRSDTARSATRAQRLSSAPARSVGPWALVEPLAIGDLTSTYLARPCGADQDQSCGYVAKTVSDASSNPEVAAGLLGREAVVGRKVCHANLVSVLDAQVHKAPYFLVTPRLPGSTFRQFLFRHPDSALPIVLWVLRQTAEALAALHSHGWLHADVKPENILIAPDGHVTLIDLGFVRRLDETGSAVDRCVMGTFNYIAPETLISAVAADQRSDIYSLGVMFYEALTGRLPFRASSLADLASQHRQARPPCVRSLLPDLFKPVASLVHRMLAKQPLRRPQSANEIVHELISLEIDTFADRRSA